MSGQCDRQILLVVFALVTIGLLAVYSATSVVTPEMVEKNSKTPQLLFFKKQLIALLLGVILLLFLSRINLRYIKMTALAVLVLSLLVLLLVFTSLGSSIKGATRWINLGFFTFQPSELVKLAMIVFLAWYMSRDSFNKDGIISFIIPIAILGVFSFIFIKQPDFGATVSLAILTISMLLLGGVKLRYIGGISLIALIAFAVLLISKPYRVRRVTAFLDPWEDPLVSGFQLIQSYIALGTGGLTGVGIGNSMQKLDFLPEVHTDFIFSLIGEEVGFVGALIVIILFCILFYRGILIASKMKDPFAYYIACGTVLMITVQAIINFSVVTGLAPTKGLPLPFISYGGSSLLVNMMAIGLLMNVSRFRESIPLPQTENRKDDETRIVKSKNSKITMNWQKGFGYIKCKAILSNKELYKNRL